MRCRIRSTRETPSLGKVCSVVARKAQSDLGPGDPEPTVFGGKGDEVAPLLPVAGKDSVRHPAVIPEARREETVDLVLACVDLVGLESICAGAGPPEPVNDNGTLWGIN